MGGIDTMDSPVTRRIGCVSFLNSKPLIEPLVNRADIEIHFAVPSKLMAMVESNEVTAALLSIVDYQMCSQDLVLVPAGMIGCDGPTLTVRIFSRVPPAQIRTLHADTDSHTSIILAQLILRERYAVTPTVLPFAAHENDHRGGPETMLLIGDKVVNASPDPLEYPHQLDLGEEWQKLTTLPFVFAMWMMRKDQLDPTLAKILADARARGAEMTETLLDHHAAARGWPRDLARRYFTEYLRYQVTPQARAGLAKFFDLAQKLNLLNIRRPLEYLEIPIQ